MLGLIGAVHPAALGGAEWYVSPLAKALVIDAILIAGGGNTVTTLAGATGPMFQGYPVNVSVVLPNVATSLDTVPMLAFGNLAMAATMGNRRGISVDLDKSVYFTSDQIALRGIERFDINVHDLGSATVQSPFVILKGNVA
jgi:HK97 family phage major capsid protein